MMKAPLPFLRADVLDRLKKYDGYEACEGESVSTPYLRPLWIGVSRKLHPIKGSIALIISFGLLATFTSILLAAVAAHNINQANVPPPASWMFFMAGTAGLIYQAVSAAEGERVREDKGKSTSLDVLVWQGLNTYGTGMLILNAAMALRPKDPRRVFLSLVLGFTTSYMVHWQKYVSGRRKMVSKSFDISEILIALSTSVLLVAITGTEVWDTKIPFLDGWHVSDPVQYGLMCGAAMTILRTFNVILEGGPGEEGMTAADTAVLSPAIPLCLALLISRHLYNTAMFDDVPYTTVVGVWILFAKIINKLVLAEISKSPLDQLDALFWPIFALVGLSFFGLEFNHTLVTDAYVFYAILNIAFYDYKVLSEISGHLEVLIFSSTVEHKKPQ